MMTDWVSIPVNEFEELAAWKQRCHDAEEDGEFWFARAEKAEARLAKVPVLVSALEQIRDDGNEGGKWQGNIISVALAEWHSE